MFLDDNNSFRLMGISAFAGFMVLLPGWPLNRYLSQCSVRILKGVLSARDKRMGALNELIRSIKFIKFFGWEEKWIKRVLDARQGEMSWFVKGGQIYLSLLSTSVTNSREPARINTVVLQLLWSTAPILVSITSFGVYVMLGNQLTISVAFTVCTPSLLALHSLTCSLGSRSFRHDSVRASPLNGTISLTSFTVALSMTFHLGLSI